MIYCESENENHSPDQAILKACFPRDSELHAVPTVPVQDRLMKTLMYEESVLSSHGLQMNICSRRIFVSTKLDPLTKVLQCVSFPLTGYQWNYNYDFHSFKYHIVRKSSGVVQTPKLFRSNVFNNGVGGDWKVGRVRAQMNCSSLHASLGKWTVTKGGNGHQEKNSFMLGGTCWSQSHLWWKDSTWGVCWTNTLGAVDNRVRPAWRLCQEDQGSLSITEFWSWRIIRAVEPLRAPVYSWC